MRNKCKIFKRGRKQAGITLVALVVTIVVLLILAGVSLSLVLDNNGIITKAGDAKEEYGKAKENEQKDLDSAEDYINKMTGGGSGTDLLPSREDGSSTPYLPSSDYTLVSGTDFSNGLVIEDGSGNQYVWIEVPKTADVYGTDNLNITNFTDAELNTIKTKLIEYATDYRESEYSDIWYDGCGVSQANYETMYNNMLESVYAHGGFWIGRYEMGIGPNRTSHTEIATDLIPTSKANQYPLTYVYCSEAQTLASRVLPSGGKYTSSLMFGLQWDLVLKYLETKETSQADLKTDSTNWGNYMKASFTVTNTKAKYSENHGAGWKTITAAGYQKASRESVLLTTGADETRNSKMNICDLAGNVIEWTLEYSSNSKFPCTERGGLYSLNNASAPASYRNRSSTTRGEDAYRSACLTLLR